MIPKITLSLLSLQYKKYISFFSNVVGSLLAATSSMLCFFLDQNKYYRPEDGFPASNNNNNNYFGSLANSKIVNQKVNQNSIPCHTTVSVLNINLIHDYCIRHFPKINDYISQHLRYITIITFT